MSAPDTALLSIIAADTGASRSTFDDILQIPDYDIQVAASQKPSYNAVFTRYKQFVTDLGATVGRQQALERSLFGSSLTKDVDTVCVGDIGRLAVEHLVRRARREFAPTGTTLEIKTFDVLEATGQADWEEKFRDRRWRKENPDAMPELDLDRIWHYLENTYGGENGRKAGLRQQAKLIVKEFNLGEDAELKRTSSHVSCFLRVWSETCDYGEGKGRYRASYQSGQRLSDLFRALACFAEYAELDALSIQLAPSRHQIGDHYTYYDLRQKHTFPGLEIVFFKSKWEYKFSHDVAEKLMLFLGEFAADD